MPSEENEGNSDNNPNAGEDDGGGGGGVFGEPPPLPPPEPPPTEPPGLPPIEPPTDPYPSEPVEPPTSPTEPTEPPSTEPPPSDPNKPPPTGPGSTKEPFPIPPVTATGKSPSTTTTTQPPIVTGGGTNTIVVSSPAVTVTVNNQIEQVAQAIKQVGDAVQQGVRDAVDETGKVVESVFGKIADALKNIGSTILDALKSAVSAIASQLGSILADIGNALKSAAQVIFKGIADALGNIRDVLVQVINKIAPVLDAITKQIQSINDHLIQPIATFINTTVKTISDLTVAIERDLHEGLSGILAIPGQIAGGLSSLDSSLSRTVQQLGETNKATAIATIDYEGATLPGKYSNATAAMLTGKTATATIASTFAEHLSLSSESLQQVSKEAISALGPLLKEVLEIVWHMCKEPFDQQHADWTAVENVFTGLLDGILSILTTFTAVGALVEPLIEAASEEARTRVPVTKLDIGSIVSALRRGFLDDSGAGIEMSKLGYDATRIKVIKDLSIYIADINSAIDWWYRGLIPESDLDTNLRQHGIIERDFPIFKQASLTLPTPDLLTRWMDFGLITQDTFTQAMRVNKWPDADIDNYLQSYQTRESAGALSNMQGRLNAWGKGWLPNTVAIATPDNIISAGAREGIHPETTRLAWLNHWWQPPFNMIVQSYFRGLRTLTEVQYAMEAQNIPTELWDDIIQISRPLIPFRSLGNYVKNGFLSESDAQQILAAHGFDLHSQNILLKALFAHKSVTAATTAQNIKTLSISNARTLYDDGALTEQEYESILQQHGYSVQLAIAQVQADQISAHIKQQKQTLSDLHNEVVTGTATLDDAVTQLQGQGFSTAQIASFQVKVQKQLKVGQKHPSIGDLKTFLKDGLITLEQAISELQAQGWTEPWITAWRTVLNPTPVLTPTTTP